MVASLHTGYDTGYLTDAVGTGADYYLGAKGEPPGYWQGAGARALGLSGPIGGPDEAGKASAEVMRRLYHEDIGPDGQVLGRRQRKANYPEAGGSLYKRVEDEVACQRAERGRFFTPEEERALRLRLRSAYRTVVPLYDLTYSAPKIVSVLWASLLAASAEAEAEGREADAERFAEQAAQVRGAVKRANDRMIAVAERELAYVRTGHHSKTTGEWRDAEGFIVASFEQHDARDGAHAAARAQRDRQPGAAGSTERMSSGGRSTATRLFRNKLRMGTLADRFLAQELELIGFLGVLREDGKAIEVGGISDEAVDEFSTRSKELRDRARELEARVCSAITATLRASKPGGRSSSGPLWRRGTPRITTRLRLASRSPRGRAKRSRAGSERCPRFTKQPKRTRRSTSRAGCRARRSGRGSSARPSPRRRPSTPRSTGRS